MSVHVCSWAWKQDVPDGSTKLVLIKLAENANDDGVCWPSQRTLARECGLSERSVRYKISRLVELGFLTVEERTRPDGGRTSNLYHLAGNRQAVAGTPPAIGCHPPRQPVATPLLEPSVEPSGSSEANASSRGESKKPRRRDLIFETLVETFGDPSNDNERGRLNKAVKLLKQSLAINGACTPEQVASLRAAVAAYPSVYPDAAWTPLAVASNWTTLHRPAHLTKEQRAEQAHKRLLEQDAIRQAGYEEAT